MPNAFWKDDYLTHDSVLDAEHRSMFKMLRELERLIAADAADTRLGAALGALVDYAAHHFVAEETLMMSTGYPSYDEHRAKHALLLTKGRELVAMHQDGSLHVGTDLAGYLESWLSTHIVVDDKPMVQWVRRQGGTVATSGHWRISEADATHTLRGAKRSGGS